MSENHFLPRLPVRPPDSHKGDFGRALLVGGSRGMAGAIALAGMATLRGGAGLVTLAVPDRCLETVAGFEPSYMTVPLPADTAGRLAGEAQSRLTELTAPATAIACGPGLGQSDALVTLVRWLYESTAAPMVVDADGLNALARHRDGLTSPGGPRVLTPHPGEFRRLAGDAALAPEQLQDRAVELARANRVVLVLKGHRTLVTDGNDVLHNATGNPGMATGGSGDVLTGVITALLCQGLSPLDAARLGVHLHGLAGDIAAQRLTERALIASDLVRFLPDAWCQYDRSVCRRGGADAGTTRS